MKNWFIETNANTLNRRNEMTHLSGRKRLRKV